MHLLNILWQKRSNIFIILLCLFFSFLTIVSFWRKGPEASFFVIDPDIVYVANALSLIYQKNIIFIDHPGTPSIIFMAFEILVSKIYLKLFLNVPDFLKYVLDNLDEYIYYGRLIQSLLFSVSMYITSYSIYKFTKKYIYVICFLIIMFVYTPVYYLGSSVSAETFNIFLLSIWLSLLISFMKGNNKKNLVIMNIVSGLLFANRATNFFVIIVSLFLYINADLSKTNIKKILTRLIYFVSMLLAGFMIGIAPIAERYLIIFKRLFLFASSTEVHGNGSVGLIDISRYFENLLLYFQRDVYFFAVVSISVIIALFHIFSKDKVAKITSKIILIFAVGILVFIKFPLGHYLVPSYYALAALFVILLSRLNYKYTLVILLTSLVPMIKTNINFQRDIAVELDKAQETTQFIDRHQSKIASVYDWSRTKAFSYLWINNYGNGIANNYLAQVNPKIYNLYTVRQNLMDVCWDNLVIQDELIKSVLLDYPDLSKNVEHIPNSNLSLVKSDHCSILP